MCHYKRDTLFQKKKIERHFKLKFFKLSQIRSGCSSHPYLGKPLYTDFSHRTLFAFKLSINHSKMEILCTLHPVLFPPGKLCFSLAFKPEGDTC